MLTTGTKLGPYEITAAIGTGGMGEVYRARDTRLDREVAVKVLPVGLAADPERLRRFEQEARAVAGLNHPNILAIYDIGTHDGAPFLVTELLEGRTLQKRLQEGRLPFRKAIDIAAQAANGVAAAHEKGIIHRDLKPANLFLTGDGRLKILDFGLAKLTEKESIGLSESQMATRTAPGPTEPGMVLGTVGYMSPEQVRGAPADARSDIFALGAILYEMLSGQRAFQKDSSADTMAAILREEPPELAGEEKKIPPAAERIVLHCLEKNPAERFQSARDLAFGLRALSAPSPTTAVSPAVSQPFRGKRLLLVIGAIAALALVGASGWFLGHRSARASQADAAMHFSAVTNFAGVQSDPALSPDGRSVAFVSNRDRDPNIYVGLIGGGNLIQVTHDPNLEWRPMWSPDGTTLAYARLDQWGIWSIWEIPALGGTPRQMILNAMDPAWSPDGHSLAYLNMADGAIWITGVTGENAHRVVARQPGWLFDTEPRFSPDGHQLAFIAAAKGPRGELDVADLASGKVRQLTHDPVTTLSPAWSPDGSFIYFASGRGGAMNIWKIASSGGDPVQITSGQGDDAQVDVSADGKRIVFSTWRANTEIARIDLDAKPGDRKMKLLALNYALDQAAPEYSPDGKQLAYFSNLEGVQNESIWVSNADGSDPVQRVRDEEDNTFPRWTPDGRNLIYATGVGGQIQYRTVPVSGGSPRTILETGANSHFDVGPDGRVLFRGPDGQVEAFDPRDGKTRTLATLPGSSWWAPMRWSPDGRSIAYIVAPSQEEDPQAGIWVNDFENPPRQIFGGWVDLWLARGPDDEIYFVKGSPDLKAELWKIGWNGRGLARTYATIPMVYSYWVVPERDPQNFFAVSPDGRYVAFTAQGNVQANVGMLEIVPASGNKGK